MHITQVHILEVLKKRSPRRYMELKPKEVESNTFMHHLKSLMRAGLLVKKEGLYVLTPAGGRYVMGLVSSGIRKKIQPLILVEVACQNERGEWLLTKCQVEPFLGLVGFPAGGIHLGETVAAAAQRVVLEKTGYEVEVEHAGNMYQQTYKEGELICHLLTHIFVGQVAGGFLREKTAFWRLDPEVEDQRMYFPGLKAVIESIQNRPKEGQFFQECVFTVG